MSLDTLHVTLKKAAAILHASTPSSIQERDPDRMAWLIHAAEDYVEEALADLNAEMGLSPEGKSPCR